MKNGDAAMQRMIDRIRAMPGMCKRAAPEAADAVHEVIDRQIAAATDPNGEPWAPRKEDGAKALQTAGKALVVVPVGSKIVMRIHRGHIGRHHHGRVKGGVERRILPKKGIPKTYAAAIKKTLDDTFAREMKGKG
jgi:hypothetical protein